MPKLLTEEELVDQYVDRASQVKVFDVDQALLAAGIDEESVETLRAKNGDAALAVEYQISWAHEAHERADYKAAERSVASAKETMDGYGGKKKRSKKKGPRRAPKAVRHPVEEMSDQRRPQKKPR